MWMVTNFTKIIMIFISTKYMLFYFIIVAQEPNCERRNCGSGECECDDGECINADWFCDNQFPPDCRDGSDEFRCCPDTQFNCANGRCIALNKQCNGQFDCRGDRTNSDELDCPGICLRFQKHLLHSQIPITLGSSSTL